MRLTKPRRQKDPAYLEWIRSRPCLICGVPQEVDAHHVRPRGYGGIGTKPSDRRAVPLCRTAHTSYHAEGRDGFEHEFDINLEDEIIRLNREYDALFPEPKRERKQKTKAKVSIQHCACGRTHELPFSKVTIVTGSEVPYWTALKFRCPTSNMEVEARV